MTQNNPPSSNQPGTPPTGPYPGDKDSRNLAMLCHLLGLFTGFVGPLIIWLIKKDQDEFVRQEGAEAINFQFTVLIMYVVAGFLCLAMIGILLVPMVFLFHFIFGIVATIKTANGETYRYPLSIPFLK